MCRNILEVAEFDHAHCNVCLWHHRTSVYVVHVIGGCMYLYICLENRENAWSEKDRDQVCTLSNFGVHSWSNILHKLNFIYHVKSTFWTHVSNRCYWIHVLPKHELELSWSVQDHRRDLVDFTSHKTSVEQDTCSSDDLSPHFSYQRQWFFATLQRVCGLPKEVSYTQFGGLFHAHCFDIGVVYL